MAGKQSAQLERKKFFADPIMVSMIVVLLVFLALFILYPLLMLLVDSFYAEGTITLDVFKRVLNLERFRNAFKNTLTLGFIVGFVFYSHWFIICLCRSICEVENKNTGKVIWSGIHASCSIPAICAVFVHDHAVWAKRYHHPFPFRYLRL